MNYQQNFNFFQDPKLTYDFEGGKLSSDGGILLIRELDEYTGISKAFAACIKDWRKQEFIDHSMIELIRERMYYLAAGYEDCNDANDLRHDPVFKLSAADHKEQDIPLSSQPTLCRLENNIDRRDIKRMAEVLVSDWLSGYDKIPAEIVLDIDSTDDPTHGGQQLAFFHGYYDQYMYHPLIISCNSNVILSILRPGNCHASSKIISVLKYLMKRIRNRFPKVKITLRADAGFAIPRLFDYLENEQVNYAIGLITNSVLVEKNKKLMKKANGLYEKEQQKQRLFQAFSYQAGSWKKVRRVIAKAEYTEKGENNRFIVTNMGKTPQILYDIFYVQRGESENWIKELKLGFYADRLSCHTFIANQFRLFLSVATHRLIHYLKKLLKGTSLAGATVDQIRLKLFKVAVRVKETTRRIWLHFCSSYPYRDLFVNLHSSILKLQT
jgi:hypothetical protein